MIVMILIRCNNYSEVVTAVIYPTIQSGLPLSLLSPQQGRGEGGGRGGVVQVGNSMGKLVGDLYLGQDGETLLSNKAEETDMISHQLNSRQVLLTSRAWSTCTVDLLQCRRKCFSMQ